MLNSNGSTAGSARTAMRCGRAVGMAQSSRIVALGPLDPGSKVGTVVAMASDAHPVKIGIGFFLADAPAAVDLIERAERAGVDTAWLVMPPLGHDTTTIA